MDDQPTQGPAPQPPAEGPPKPEQLLPKSPPRDRGGWTGALISWAIIGLVTLTIAFLMQAEPQIPEGAEAPPIAPASPMLAANAKLALVAKTDAERDQVMALMPWINTGSADDLRIAILIAELQDTGEALFQLDVLRETATEPVLEDIDLVEAILRDGMHAVDEPTREQLEQRHGWFARLAFAHQEPFDSEVRTDVFAEANRSFAIQAMFSLGMILAGVLAVVLSITAVVLLAMGKIKRRYSRPGLGGSVFLEAFAVFLVLFVLVQFAVELMAPIMGPSADLLRWGCLLALLWPRLRGTPWININYAVGWHRGRGVFKEIVLGMCGYMAMLPIVAIGIVVSLGLLFLTALGSVDEEGGEGGALPTHPLPDMLGQAGALEVLIIVQLATLWAPIVEETFFRGALYHHLRGRFGLIFSALLSGFIFAALHPQGLFGIPALMSIALCMSLLREWRGTIIAPAAAHALNNGTITALILFLIAA